MKILHNNKCPICDNYDILETCSLSEDNYESFINYSDEYYDGLLGQWLSCIKPVLFNCTLCNHFFYKDIPGENMLSQMYDSLIRKPGLPAPDREPSKIMVSTMRKVKRLFSKPKPFFLDYGAGYGRWSAAAHYAGFEVYSYEPNTSRIRKYDGIKYISSINEIQSIKFDFIWLEQVLEHVISPKNILCDIKNLMDQNTIFTLSVPNLDKFFHKVNLWRKWPYDNSSSHIMAPYQHLHGFSNKSLSILLENEGFKNLSYYELLKIDRIYTLRLHLGKYLPILSTTRRYCQIID